MNTLTKNIYMAATVVFATMTTTMPAEATGQQVQQIKSILQTYKIDAAQLDDVSYELEAAESQLGQLESSKRNASERLSRFQSEQQQLKTNIDRKLAQKNQNKNKLTKLERRLPELKNRRQQKKSAVTNEEARLKPKKQLLKQADKKHTNVKAKLLAVNKELKATQGQMKRDQNTLKTASANIKKAKSSIAAFEAQIVKTKGIINNNKVKLDKVDKDITQNQSKITGTMQKIKSLPPKDPKRAQLVKKLRSLRVAKQNLARSKKQINADVTRNQKVLQGSQKKKRSKTLALSRFQKDRQIAKERLAINKANIPKLQNRKSNLSSKLQLAKSELAQAQRNYSNASAKLKQLQRQLADIKSKVNNNKNKQQQLSVSIRNITRNLVSLRESARNNRTYIQNIKQNIENLRARVSQAVVKVDQLSSERSQLKRSLKNAVLYSHQDSFLHVVAGATNQLNQKTLDAIENASLSGLKTIIWVTPNFKRRFVSNYAELLGASSVQTINTSSILGLGVLEGMSIQQSGSHSSIEMFPSSSVLLESAQRVLLSAHRYNSSVLVTAGIDGLQIKDVKLAKILSKLKKASVDEILGDDSSVPGNPVNPPTDKSKLFDFSDISVAIPDNSSEGVSHSFNLKAASARVINSIELLIEIEHSYIGDLKVELVHPSGKSVILHSNQGGGQDNLRLSADSQALSALVGMQAVGTYSVVVTDSASRDIGFIKNIQAMINY